MENDLYYESPPLSPGSRPATERCSVAQLSLQMSQYSLRQREYVDYLTNDTYPSDFGSDSSASPIQIDSPNSTFSLSPTSTQASSTFPPSSPDSVSLQLPSGYHSTNIRQQRQQALRRQCSATHLLEISELVARMVNEGDQCSVSQATNIRSRQNSDPTSDSSPVILCADESGNSMEEYSSDPEPSGDPFEGFKIREEQECVPWTCPWTSRGRSADTKCCIKKNNTIVRKRSRRRAH